MAESYAEAGNKLSLRSKAIDQPRRVESISGNLGVLGDTYVSTFRSILLSLLALAAPIIILVMLVLSSAAIKQMNHAWLPILLIVIGDVFVALNVFFVNPTRGSQLLISLQYVIQQVNNYHFGQLLFVKPYRFAPQDRSHTILESTYKKRRRYTAVFKTHGSVSRTTFENDRQALTNVNKASLEAMDRVTVRTPIVAVGRPTIEPKELAANATPEMKYRRKEIDRSIVYLGRMQTLDTYVCLDSTTLSGLEKQLKNLAVYFNSGLVIDYRLLSGKELKATWRKFFA